MSTLRQKYDRLSQGFTESSYRNASFYIEHRADIIMDWQLALQPGDEVLEIGCGDGSLMLELALRGIQGHGIDFSPGMINAATRRCMGVTPRPTFDVLDINHAVEEFEKARYACIVALMRHFPHYVHNIPKALEALRSASRGKVIVDVNPRDYPVEALRDAFLEAGFRSVATRGFLVPQTLRLPTLFLKLLVSIERLPPAVQLLTKRNGFILVSGVI